MDPSGVYAGLIRIGGYGVRGPISTDTGEIIRKVSIPRIGVDLIPEGKRICALLIGFKDNEHALKVLGS
jgi:hypothetical protein